MEPPDPDYILRSSKGPVAALTFLRLGQTYGKSQLLLTGTQHGAITLWDLDRRRPSVNVETESGILWLSVISEEHILSQGRNGVVTHWRISAERDSKWAKEATYDSACMGFCQARMMKLSDNRNTLVLAAKEQSTVDVIDMQRKTRLHKLKPLSTEKRGMCMALAVATPEGVETASSVHAHMVLVGYESGDIILWDLDSEKEIAYLKAHDEAVMCMDYNSEHNFGVSGSADDKLCIWFVDSECLSLCQRQKITITNPGVNCVKVRKDGRLFVSGGWDGKVRLFSCKKLRPLVILDCHLQSILCLEFDLDNTLAVGAKDGTVSLWNIYKSQ